jgi:hypothetical protein
MIPKLKDAAVRSLRTLLDGIVNGASIDCSDNFRDILSSLEFFLPEILQEKYQEWKDEEMDGIYPAVAYKIRPGEVEIIGLCILNSDQTFTPIHILLKVSTLKDEIEWLECKVGELDKVNGEMMRIPYRHDYNKLLVSVAEKINSIDWIYKIRFGQRYLTSTLFLSDHSAV